MESTIGLGQRAGGGLKPGGKLPDSMRPVGIPPDRPHEKTMLNDLQALDKNGKPPNLDIPALDLAIMSSGIFTAFVELLVILVISQLKLKRPMKYLSINFLSADLIFHLANVGNVLVKLTPRADPVWIKTVPIQISTCVSFLAITLLALERVVAIKWPLKHMVYVTKGRTCAVIAGSWCLHICLFSAIYIKFILECVVNGRKCKQKRWISNHTWVPMTLLLVMYEVMNIAACCSIARHLHQHRPLRHHRIKQLVGSSSTNNTDVSPPTNARVVKHSNGCHAHDPDSAKLTVSKDNRLHCSESNDTSKSEQPNHFCCSIALSERVKSPKQLHNGSSQLPIASSRVAMETGTRQPNTARVNTGVGSGSISLIVVTMAATQLVLHMPAIAFQLQMQFIPSHRAHVRTPLHIASNFLVQLSTLPGLFLYLLRLRGIKVLLLRVLTCGRITND